MSTISKFWDKYWRAGASVPLFFYMRGFFFRLVPRGYLNWRRRRLLKNWESRPDAAELRRLRDLLCPVDKPFSLPDSEAVEIREVTASRFHSRYGLDAERVLRYFPAHAKVAFHAGDILENPSVPTLTKGRRLAPGRENGVMLRLDSIRHYLHPHDPIPFSEKADKLFFRGEIHGKPLRVKFMEQWAENPMFDIGDTCRHHPSQWAKPFVSIPDQFGYKFILALEGNDVASALQWIMASNCVPVMPRPTVETWLLHSELIPGRHYIEIAPDFSDVGEKISYYISHPEEAEAISRASREYASRFFDRRRERLLALLTVEKYLNLIRPWRPARPRP